MGAVSGDRQVDPFPGWVGKGSENWVYIRCTLYRLVVANIKARFSGGVRAELQDRRFPRTGTGLRPILTRTRGGVSIRQKTALSP